MGNQRTISFRLDEEKIEALDGLAESVDRDLLDEEAHAKLDRVNKDEVVIFTRADPTR